MTKLAILGDSHGNISWLVDDVIPYAQRMGAQKLVQVGDRGVVWPAPNYLNTLHKLNRVLDRAGLDFLFLPGNHDDHTKLAEFEASHERNEDGHTLLASRIAYTGRVSAWAWAGRRFGAVGGAVSIDREFRIKEERRTGTPIWWPEEVLSQEEREAALALGQVEVLLTHDAPSAYPVEGLKADLDSTANRQLMTDVGRALRPKLWFHGHYHRYLIYPFYHDEGVCEVHSLDRDKRAQTLFSVSIVDLADDVVVAGSS